jgi:heat shock protein HslJ
VGLVVAVALAIATAGCGGGSATVVSPTSITAEQLSGRWRLQRVVYRTGGYTLPPQQIHQTLTFDGDGVFAAAHCAACATVASFSGSDVWFGALTCTDTPCAPAIEGTDAEFPVLLPGRHQVALTDGSLTLTSERARLEFAR